MIARMTGALVRSLMVALLVLAPALLLQGVSADATQVLMLLALLAAMLTFAEYNSAYPCLLEFRNAPPFNRTRFLFTLIVVVSVSMIVRGIATESEASRAFVALGRIAAQVLDVPFSPVRLLTLVLSLDAPESLVTSLRLSASLAYAMSILMIVLVFGLVWLRIWPARNGPFNVWINLPLFDPTGGGDVVVRLRRDARLNFSLGFLLPFLLPAFGKMATQLLSVAAMENPQTFVWTVTLWAMFPAMLITRGLAMVRIADMIETKRRRAYAQAEADGVTVSKPQII